MIRKAYMIGTVAVGLALAAITGTPDVSRVASSVRNFQQNCRNLKATNSFNPVERFVLSLVLAGSETQQPEKKATSPRS